MKYKNWPVTRRDTSGDLFKRTLELVQFHGHYSAAENIMDYALPESLYNRTITCYDFDFQAIVNTGSSEGIYIDCLLNGHFDDSKDVHVKAGTFKTLRCDVEAYKIMGELAGAMIAYSDIYVNQNIERYTPDEERLSMLSQYNMSKELVADFHKLFDAYNSETTRHWLRFLGEHNQQDSYKSSFSELIEQFALVKEVCGAEIAQKLYHNVWALALKPKQLMLAAIYLKEGHSCMELCGWAEKGFLH